MSFNFDNMPPDPFADDPNDPASFLEPDDVAPAVSAEERRQLLEDLRNIRDFRSLLKPRGIRGITMLCEDCSEPHYYDWDIVEANITMMLREELVPVHEPSVHLNPEEFVTWDYCLGYAEAMDFALGGIRPPFLWGEER